MTEPPRPAKLELLVRGAEGEETFEVRQVGSALAFVRSRPQRVPPESFELAPVASRVGGGWRYILKNTATDRFLLLTEPERFLWEQMDGRTSLQDIATAYVLRYGELDFEILPNLIRKLQRAQLLRLTPVSRLRAALERNRGRRLVKAIETTLFGLERINISTRRVQPLLETLYRLGGFLLFTRLALVACLGLAVTAAILAVQLLRDVADLFQPMGAAPVLGVVGVKLLLFVTVAVHQIVHGLACIHYRRRVREFGFTFLHGIVPTFYVDVTDIFMASRRARLVTAVSGALVHLVLGACWFLLAAALPAGFAQAFAAASGIIQWQALVISLYPFGFVELDGYHIFVDLLGVPTLKHDALAYARRLLTGAEWPRAGREEALWVGYVVLSVLSVVGFAAFNVWIILAASA